MPKIKRKKKKSNKIKANTNSYGRMHVPTPKKVGAILAVTTEDELVLTQFSQEDAENSYFTKLNIHTPPQKKLKSQGKALETTPNGFTNIFPAHVTTPNGTAVQSHRSYDVSTTQNGKIMSGSVFLFSPERQQTLGLTNLETNASPAESVQPKKVKRKASDVFAEIQATIKLEKLDAVSTTVVAQPNDSGSIATTPPQATAAQAQIVSPIDTQLINAAGLKSEVAATSQKNSKDEADVDVTPIKGGVITPLHICHRKRKQFPQQKTIMNNQSASACLNRAVLATQANKEKTDPKLLKIMMLLVNTFKLEWLHAIAFSLASKNFNPQTKENLGCSSKWNNTFMMTLESVAKYFDTLHPNMVSIKPTFTMLGDDEALKDIIKEIHYEVTIIENKKEITIKNKLNALALPSRKNWPSTTDGAQLTLIINALLNDMPPTSTKRLL